MLIDLDTLQDPLDAGSIDPDRIEVKGFHCTRAVREDIASRGLQRFMLDERLTYLTEKLLDHGVTPGIVNSYGNAVRTDISGGQLAGRDGLVCLSLNRRLFEVEDGCDRLLKYFGGEAMFRVAHYDEAFSEVSSALQVMGEPLVITASLKLSWIPEFQRQKVIRRLAGQTSESCEVFISHNICPDRIIDICTFRKDI